MTYLAHKWSKLNALLQILHEDNMTFTHAAHCKHQFHFLPSLFGFN